MKLLILSGDQDLINGKKGPFYYLLEELSKYWERIDVICPSADNKKQKFFANVWLTGSAKNTEVIYQTALKLKEESSYDVITAHDYPPFRHTRVAGKISRKFNLPFMIEIHHVVGFPRAANFKEALLRIFFQLFFKKVSRRTRAIRVVNNNQTRKFLERLGISAEKIKYLPSFYIDHGIFYPQNLEKKYDLMFAGRLAKNKGLDLLLEILTGVKKVFPGFKIAIVGEGTQKKKFESQIRQAGLADNIEFLGWLKDFDQLAEAYNQAKVLLITSDNEGGPRVGLEAMACGVPVISTRVGLMLDIIKNGENGYLADWRATDFTDKIIKVLQVNNYQSLSSNSQKAAEQFNYSALVKDYANFLKNLK